MKRVCERKRDVNIPYVKLELNITSLISFQLRQPLSLELLVLKSSRRTLATSSILNFYFKNSFALASTTTASVVTTANCHHKLSLARAHFSLECNLPNIA